MSNDSRFQIAKQRIDALFDKPLKELLGDSRHPHLLILFILSLRKFGALPISLGESVISLEKYTRQLWDEKDLPYYLVLKELKPVIDEIGQFNLTALIIYFQNEDFNLDEADAQTLFDSVFRNYLLVKGKTGSNYVPAELASLISKLVPLFKDATVYEPFARLGFARQYLADDILYFGQAYDAFTWCAGAMQLFYSRPKDTTFFDLVNSVDEWLGIYEIDKEATALPFDLLLSMPPFRLKLSERFNAIHDGRPIRYVEEFVIDRGIHSISENGKLIVFVTNAFLTSVASEQRLREYVVKNGLLKMVIQLPVGLLQNTNIPVVMLVFSKEQVESGKIHFVDASTFFKKANARINLLDDQKVLSETLEEVDSEYSRFVAYEEIADEDFTLNVNRYFIPKVSGLSLSDILSPANQSRRLDSDLNGKLVRIRDLRSDIENYKLSTEDLEDSDNLHNTFKLEQSALLIAGRWRDMRQTYFEFTGTPLFVSNDIYAFNIDTTQCDISYLFTELAEPHVIRQFEFLTSGDTIPRISGKDFLRITIHTPPLKEQKELAKLRIETFIHRRNQALLAELKKKGLEAALYSQNAYLRHTLVGPASNLKDAIENIFQILNNQVATKLPELLDMKVSNKHLKTLGEYMKIISRDAAYMQEQLARQLKDENEIGQSVFELVDLVQWLKNYVEEYNDRKNIPFKIVLLLNRDLDNEDGTPKSIFVNGSTQLLNRMIDNIIENAVQHAFPGSANNRIELALLSPGEFDKITLLVSNTGKQFPKDLTFEEFIRKGQSWGPTGGTGIGAWMMNEIIKAHNGDWDIIDETGPAGLPGTDLATSFEIHLPFIQNPDQNDV